jgi:hypothetical protein
MPLPFFTRLGVDPARSAAAARLGGKLERCFAHPPDGSGRPAAERSLPAS